MKVPGTFDHVKRVVALADQNKQLSALLCAVLDAHGGTATLTQEQAERTWERARLKLENLPEGGVTLSLVIEGTP